MLLAVGIYGMVERPCIIVSPNYLSYTPELGWGLVWLYGLRLLWLYGSMALAYIDEVRSGVKMTYGELCY